MLTEDYRVRLEAFEGPLDLLLYLIRKAEVDIHDIPVARITEQYLEFLRQLELSTRIDIDTAGEFLVMAASLMEIKSRMLAGVTARGAETADVPGAESKGPAADPRAELVRQLLEYKKYRDAADSLEHRAEDWRRRFPAKHAGVDQEALRAAIEGAQDVEMEDLDLLDLVEAFQKIADSVNFERLGDHEIKYDDTPIELHAADIVTRLEAEKEQPELELVSLFKGRSRSEMVGLFLALLELVRNRRVAVRQDKIEGGIYLRMRAAEEPETPALSDTTTGD